MCQIRGGFLFISCLGCSPASLSQISASSNFSNFAASKASGLAVCSAGKEWWSALGLLQDMAQQQLQLGRRFWAIEMGAVAPWDGAVGGKAKSEIREARTAEIRHWLKP